MGFQVSEKPHRPFGVPGSASVTDRWTLLADQSFISHHHVPRHEKQSASDEGLMFGAVASFDLHALGTCRTWYVRSMYVHSQETASALTVPPSPYYGRCTEYSKMKFSLRILLHYSTLPFYSPKDLGR